jgi:galactokinase
MFETHKDCLDYEVSCAELDMIVDTLKGRSSSWFPINGCGFGGCINLIKRA